MPTRAYFVTHPDVVIDAAKPIERWSLSARGKERMRAMLEQPWLRRVGLVLSSSEQKALDAAEVLVSALAVRHDVVVELGEFDRSSTGLLPPAEFLELIDEFFRKPMESIRGWERAVDAQARVLAAVRRGVARASEAADPERPDLVLVAHGAVGTLLLASLSAAPISRQFEQPPPPVGSAPGAGGGHYFSFSTTTLRLEHGWRAIEPEPPLLQRPT